MVSCGARAIGFDLLIEPFKLAEKPIGRLNAIWNSVKRRALRVSVLEPLSQLSAYLSITCNIHVNSHDGLVYMLCAALRVCTSLLFIFASYSVVSVFILSFFI